MSFWTGPIRPLAVLVLGCAASAFAATTQIALIMANQPNSSYLGQTVTIQGGVVAAIPANIAGISGGLVYIDALPADRSGTLDVIPIYGAASSACTNTNDQIEATGVVRNLPSATATGTAAVALEVTSCTVTGTTTVSDDKGRLPSFSTYADGLNLSGVTYSDYATADVSPSEGIWDDATATVTPLESYYGVANSTAVRVFRLPGIYPNEFIPLSAPSNVLKSVGRPDLIIESHVPLTTPNSFTVGQHVLCTSDPARPEGIGDTVLDWTTGTRRLIWLPYATCEDDSGYTGPLTKATAATSGQINIGTLDLFRFFDDHNDGFNDPVVTTAGYTRRKTKAAMAIADIFALPEIMAVQEVENQNTLADLALSIDQRAATNSLTPPNYQVYIGAESDNSNLQNGFLVNTSSVDVITSGTAQQNDTYTASSGVAPLWESAPFVLKVAVHRPLTPYKLTLINVRFAARENIDDPTLGPDVRTHREAQAVQLASLIQSYQSAGERVIVLGNFNANEFNDGFIDVVNAVAGSPAPAEKVTVASPSAMVTPALHNLTTDVPAADRYNIYVKGEAQSYEHILTSQNISAAVTQTHFSADYARVQANLDTTPAALTPHDGQLATLPIPPPQANLTADTSLNFGDVPLLLVSTKSANIKAASDNDAPVTFSSLVISGPNASDFILRSTCSSFNAGDLCQPAIDFIPQGVGPRTATLTVTSNSTNMPTIQIALSGNGVMATALTPLLADFGAVVVGENSATKTFTWKNETGASFTIPSVTVPTGYQITANTCTGVIAAAGSCNITVVFSPTVIGAQNGTLTLEYDLAAAKFFSTAALSGTGVPALTITPAALEFGKIDITGISASQPITIRNNSVNAVALASLQVTPGFQLASSTCGSTLAPGATCIANISFAPTQTGDITGTFAINAGLPTAVSTSLHGIGVDFTISVSPDHGDTIAGLDTSLKLLSTSIAGYNSNVTLTCTTDAVASLCDLPANMPVPSTRNITIHTTAKYTVVGYEGASGYLVLFAIAGGICILIAIRRRSALPTLLALAFIAALTTATGCSGKLPDRNTPYTEPGEYQYTISATDGILTRTAIYTLKVRAK